MKNKNKAALIFGAIFGSILALILQKNIHFLREEIKTLIIAFSPWAFAELFSFIYKKLTDSNHS